MKLLENSSPSLLCIADKDLPELHFGRNSIQRPWELQHLEFHLSRLTALTKLVFCHFSEPGHHVSTQTLAWVKELVLYDCLLTAPTFFEPGALTSLQRLHLEKCEADWPEYDTTRDQEEDLLEIDTAYHNSVEKRESELHMAATALLSLPQLSQISGDYPVNDGYLSKQLGSAWERSAVLRSDLGLTFSSEDKEVEDFYVDVWTKA